MIEPVTAESMRHAYEAWAFPATAKAVRIVECHAMEHRVEVSDLTGQSRARAIVRVRQSCMARLRRETSLSLSEIGRLFGRDHTTVLHSLRMAAAGRDRT